MEKLDYKKVYKELYTPPKTPSVIEVPRIQYLTVQGKGNPNDENGEYQEAVELLYGVSYTIKFSSKNGLQLEGYFDYMVPPLEGLWWTERSEVEFEDKKDFCWISMIRQPEFVTAETLRRAGEELKKKKPYLPLEKLKLQSFTEGKCVQLMHRGSYDSEPESIAKAEAYMEGRGLEYDLGTVTPEGYIRRHHEIYLSDPNRCRPENLKTVLRFPVKEK